MVQLCECKSKRHLDKKNQMTLVKDTKVTTTFNYEQDANIVLDYNVELIFFTGRPLPAIATPKELAYVERTFPISMDPIHPHISIENKPLPAFNEFFRMYIKLNPFILFIYLL